MMERPKGVPMPSVGTKIRIISMEGEPHYNGKSGTITKINPAYPSLGILEQWHGTWGGCAVQPARDLYEVLT